MSEKLAQLKQKGGGGSKSLEIIEVPIRNANTGVTQYDGYIVTEGNIIRLPYGSSNSQIIAWLLQSPLVSSANVTAASGYPYLNLNITLAKGGTYIVDASEGTKNVGDVITFNSSTTHLLICVEES